MELDMNTTHKDLIVSDLYHSVQQEGLSWPMAINDEKNSWKDYSYRVPTTY